MKILLINNIGRDAAGAEAMVRQLKEGLIAAGHDARLLAGDTPSPTDDLTDYVFHSFAEDSVQRYLLYVCNPFAVWRLRKVLKDFKPDIVHLHNASRLSPFVLPLLKGLPTVLTIHDHMVFDPTRLDDLPEFKEYGAILDDYFIHTKSARYFGEKVRFFFARRFSKYIDVAIACSSFYGRSTVQSRMFKRVEVIHNGINLPKFSPNIDGKDILFVGRIDDSKGVDLLLRAMKKIEAIVPGARLTIVGDGSYKTSCQDLAKQLHLKSVNFLGRKTHSESLRLMAKNTLLVVPSRYPDNLPTVCLEAMATGRPVVAAAVGGIPEMVIDGDTGLLFRTGDSDELAEKIADILRDPGLARRMGRAARSRAEKEFSVQKYIHTTIKLYIGTIK
ncbi:MAG TPA: glycosyltransferase family 4 protein [Bacillota bacterium]|nr:glycosyltransferase family 4 protein [Bacillota bacterium]